MSWTPTQMSEQRGKRVVITGANSGIGLEAAKLLAGAGAQVVLTCRSQAKADGALAAIRAVAPDAELGVVLMDLAELASVARAAQEIVETYGELDALVNNAGIMAIPRQETADGFEMQLGTNHLGHFALTAQVWRTLLPRQGRVVNLSSLMHRRGRMDFDDLMGVKRYDKWAIYAQSKLANLLFTLELQRRFERAGLAVRAVACHPGYASTNLQGVGPQQEGSALMARFMDLGNRLIAQSAEQGAWPTVRAVVDPNLRGGEYLGPNGPFEVRGEVDFATIDAKAKDPEVARRLFDVSETLTGVPFPIEA